MVCGGLDMKVEQELLEKKRWTNLGESFITLGTLLQKQPALLHERAEERAKKIYRNVYQQVCHFCSKVRWCWGEESAYTLEMFGKACDAISLYGLQKESVFSTKFQGRCLSARQIEVALFNQILVDQAQEQNQKKKDDVKESIAQQMIWLGEQMQRTRNAVGKIEINKERLIVGHANSRKESISGDSWGVLDLQDGRLVQILCDGMGSGVDAQEQSGIAVKLLQTLLSGGISVRLSLDIMNTVLSFQCQGGRFSTVDVAVWNLNTRRIELYKHGAAPSFVRSGKTISTYVSDSLPVGILPRVEGVFMNHVIQKDDMLIMMSDGLYELTNNQFKWEQIISNMPTANPQLMAEYLLAIATSRSRGNQKIAQQRDEKALDADDMTVLVSKLI